MDSPLMAPNPNKSAQERLFFSGRWRETSQLKMEKEAEIEVDKGPVCA